MMSNSVASYDQLVRQVEDLRKENSHLRRELEDNSHHLSKLENETSDMKEVLKHLQGKLEQEACTLASSGRADVLDQLKELHMDLTNYYELKYQPHNLRVFSETTANQTNDGEDRMQLSSSSISRSRSSVCSSSHQCSSVSGEGTAMHPSHLHPAVTAEGRVTAQHLEELRKERTMLLNEIEKEEKERHWYYSQLQGLSRRLAELPRIDTFSIQMDLIRQQLEFEVQQLRLVMEERFGTSDEMVQRTQIRVTRLEQLDKELQEAQGSRCPQEKIGQSENQNIDSLSKASVPEMENGASTSTMEAPGEAGNKVEMMFWLLSMLASRDREEMSRVLLAMSSSQESCIAMRKSGCVPLLVQILHDVSTGKTPDATGCSREARSRASAALHNIVYSQPDEGQARREMRVLHVLEQIRSHCENGWDWIENHVGTPSPSGTKTTDIPEPLDPQICQAICVIMKLSFEEDYRRAMNELGGLQAIAELMQLEQEVYGMQNEPMNMALRRYAGMALTNLTYGDVVNKATLCSKKSCLQAIVAQLASDSEELHQVVSSILRNLSWRADITSKRALRDVGSVSALMTCALQATKESTLKSVLSALWNLSAHSTENKMAICSVDGALGFLVSTLTYQCQTNSLAIIESGGGILRNVSSLIATRDDYRQVLRDHNCLQTLLQHLRSHSLTIVSNACGTLWNLSARSPKDQELLWDLGAVSMLRNLIHSKHKMIAMGSAAALRNLLTNRPLKYKDTAVISPGSCMPSLYMRKQKALEAELDAKHLAETFDSIEKQSPRHMNINKPLRHIESLAKDYASDSGCFDDDEAPNVSSSIETGTFSMLSMFLNNSNFLQNQPRRREGEPERDVQSLQTEDKKTQSPDDEVTVAAEKLAKKITNTVAKIDKLVEDITMHTSSEDSFSLSSEDHFADWNYGPDDLHEARAKLCSPCRLSDNSFSHKDHLSKAHALLRLKTVNSSISNDSLNSGSNNDSCCSSNDQIQSSVRPAEQRRPNKLELKVAHKELLNSGATLSKLICQNEIPERDSDMAKDLKLPDYSTVGEQGQEALIATPATVSTRVSSDASIPTIKLSPSYQHVPLTQNAMFGTVNVQASQAMKKQTWDPTVTTGENISKFSPICSSRSPIGQLETPQKYSVENTPICFSRCSSLSSLSSGDGDLDGQSENDLESDSSLEIIEVEDGDIIKKDDEDETLEDLSDSQLLMTDQKTCPTTSSTSDPIEIPMRHEKTFLREASAVILEDRTPSSSSENYLHETPLVMSRCSSVSSLGSFESPSIASSIQSDPCSEMVSGTVSPSDLPDSPGQTMPPSRSKTPCCADVNGPEQQNIGGIGGQWENGLRKFMEIADLKERFNLPQDLDTMIYFTVEKPLENFSCASSLSALPLHEHYVQKDVELKLTPLLNQQDNEPVYTGKRNPADYPSCMDQDQYSEGNSDDDIEILKECINSAMPSRFKKQKKKQATRKRKGEAKQKQKTTQKETGHWDPEDDLDSEEMASDKDSDLNSVEWRAIQEGANTIITKLQASKSQEPSSESDSVLSFISGSSFTPKPDINDKKKAVKENKKANKPLDFAPRKPVPNLPVVFRGRTVIYTPKKEKTLSQRPPPKKVMPKSDGPKNPSLAQHRSRSLHRLGHLSDSTQLSLPKRSSTPPARIPKSSSSGSSQSSTPSRQPQKKVTPSTQTIKQNQKMVTSDPDSPPDKKRGTSMSNQNPRSADNKTQKSPVRIPFMQNSSKQARAISPLVTNQLTSISRQNSQLSGKRISPASRLDLVRMTSAHSCSGESDHNGFLRQLTFIKESSRQNVSCSRSVPTSKHVSPRRTCPGAPAVFLCSSRCEELKSAVQGPRRLQGPQGPRNGHEQGILKQSMALPRANSSDRNFTVKRPARRTSSESPCRVPQRTVPEPNLRETREDTFKRYSSSPSINILSRVTSRSSLRSSSSDSSVRAKSEKDTKQRQNRAGSRNNNNKVTWRRIRDEDIPQILKSTLPPTALPLVPSPEGHKPMPPPLPGKLPTITLISRKTSDATVQTEDLSTNKTNSSTSPTIENGSMISEEVAKMALLRRISLASVSNLHDGDSDGSLKNYSTASTSTFQSVESSHSGVIGPFRQSAPSKAVRVTPFNYVPSPMAYCSQDTQSHAPTIPEKSGEKLES
ncbi:hypothetical protein PHYPO_G00027610 [Pangasianodon hypophthalmus]|uniref:Adenomatous polyposis coli protein 2 n=1 Tax=Pangasianodon hypophthalmus TaxID=310915 RepID=A0A5N5MWF9_PANHP|nr:hypothetical protein PHYPO_G00027610 [Pangasianodon hypophthalmus]